MNRVMLAWILAEPSAEVAGEWVAHCLDLDVVTQGSSLQQAIDMLAEAIAIVVADDLMAGRDSLGHRAPEADFERVWTMMEHESKRIRDLSEADRLGAIVFGQAELDISVDEGAKDPKAPARRQARPVAMFAAV